MTDYQAGATVQATSVSAVGVFGQSDSFVGVVGQAGTTPNSEWPEFIGGVVGLSESQPGIVGWSTAGHGIESWAYNGHGLFSVSAYKPGVYGTSLYDYGVWGWSEYSIGVYGYSPNFNGVYGLSSNFNGVSGYSHNGVGVVGYTGNSASYAGGFGGNVLVMGTLTATAKNGVVPFPDGTQRLLHCMESPEHWFEDFGTAKLRRGRAIIGLDADFSKVIRTGDYHVFVTPEGDCRGLYVRRRGARSFEVRELNAGKSSIAFSYRIVGRRKDIKQHRRFAKIDMSLPPPSTAVPTQRKPAPSPRGLRDFVARMKKEALARETKGAAHVRAPVRRRAKAARSTPTTPLRTD
jgi:hypothetical protein